MGLSGFPVAITEYFDLIWADLFPDTTRELTAWEAQFGLPQLGLTEDERRERLLGYWQATGGQDPSYIQATLQASGFDVYVHEWWEVPAAAPPVARDPASATYLLVNKLYRALLAYTCACGGAQARCGEARARCGDHEGFVWRRAEYDAPTDPTLWPYFLYIGGSTFGDEVDIPANRMDEFEDLCLKMCPAHLWIGMYINYVSVVIEDETGNTVLEDETGNTVIVEV